MTDSEIGQSPTTASALELKYVHLAYRASAPHFRHRKYKLRSKVKQFLNALEPGALVADVGCGDGRYFQVNERISVVGVDICLELLKQTNISGKLCDVVAANNICLPFRSNCFDATISVNVIHHLATRERRLQSLSELARVLKPGGKLLVYVWALEQNHRGFSSQDVMVPWRNPPTEEDSNDSTDGCESDSFAVDNSQIEPINTGTPVIETKLGVKSSLFSKLGSLISSHNAEIKCATDSQSLPPPPRKIGFGRSIREVFDSFLSYSPNVRRRLRSLFASSGETIESAAEEFATQLAQGLMAQSLQILYEAELVNGRLGVVDGGRNSSIGDGDKQQPRAFRFYHVFRQGELEELLGEVDSLKITKSFYDRANWCVTAIKPIAQN